MDFQVVEGQIYLPVSILDQSGHKGNQALAVYGLFVEHESDLGLIGERGNHVDTFFLSAWGTTDVLPFRE